MLETIPTLLIIASNPEDRAFFRGYLSQAGSPGYEFVEEALGSRGLAAALNLNPAGILLDEQLPDMAGLELLTQLQRQSGVVAWPVVLLVTAGNEEAALQALAQGVQDYLVKGQTSPENLRRVVAKANERTALLRQVEQQGRALAEKNRELETALYQERTERQQTEAALEGQRAFLRQVIDLNPHFIFAKDRQGRFTLANQAVADAYGTTVEALLGQTDANFNPRAAEVEHFRQDDLEVMDTLQEKFIPEESITDAAGQVRWLQTIKRPLIGQNGLADQVLGVALDITERRQAEESLAKTANSLARERERLTVALRAGQLGVYEWRVGAPLVWWSPEIYSVYGVEPESFIPTVENFNALIHPDDREELWQKTEDSLSRREVFIHEYRIIRPDGEVRWIANRSHVSLDATGQVELITGVAVNITERKQTEQALRESERRQRLLADLGEIIRGVEVPDELLLAIVQTIGEHLQVRRCLFIEIDTVNDRAFIQHEYCRDVPPVPKAYRVSDYSATARLEMEAGQTAVNRDAQLDPRTADIYEDVYGRYGERAYIAVPLLRGGLWVSVLWVSTDTPRDWNSEEIALLETVAERAWLGIENARLNAATRATFEQLRQSEQRYRSLFDNNLDPIFSLETEGHFLAANAAAEQISGYSLEELQSLHFLRLCPPEGREEAAQVFRNALCRQCRDFETVMVRKDGRHVDLFITGAPVIVDGEVVGVSCIARDITARKAADRALRESEEALREGEQMLALAMRGGRMGAWWRDLATNNVWWSRELEELFGLEPGGFSGTEAGFYDFVYAEDRPSIAYKVEQAITEHTDYLIEFRFHHADGSLRWMEGRGRAVYSPEGQPLRLYGIGIDITERKKGEEALRQAHNELEQRVIERTAELELSLQELNQFTYVASHDLKAPLRAVKNLANWITTDTEDLLPESSKTHLAKMQNRIGRMEKFLDDLLVYSRVGRYYYQRAEDVDPVALAREAIDSLAPPPGFTITVQPDMPALRSQRILLEIVFKNLLDNALKHHHRSAGQIQISARELDSFIEFSVTDDGPGIDPMFHERIFQIFQTLRPRDELEATGAGLAIVKKAVESQGGAIQVISAEGQGTTFRFTWPKDSNINS